MKTLQSDFTTPKQSKRLLELGVPKITANYYYDSRDFKPQAHEVRGHWNEEEDKAFRHGFKITPLWSVGRLIEIFSKCYTGAKCYYSPRNLYKTEFWIERFERLSKIGFINFSKLED